MKSELNVKQCTSQIFWWSFLHNFWLGIVGGIILGVIYAVLRLVLKHESELIEKVLTIAFGAIAWFISVKITTNTIYKNHTINVSILSAVAKRLWTIYIILSVISISITAILIPVKFNMEVEALERYESFYGETKIQQVIEEARSKLPSVYALEVGSGVSSLILSLIFTKYAVHELEKKYTLSTTTANTI